MENYKTIDGLISELKAQPYFKDNPDIIDKASVYRWVNLALKQFGLNIMEKQGVVLEISNYKGILPSNFGKLSLAVFCECDKAFVPEEQKDRLLSTYFYKSRVENKFIIETEFTNDGCKETICPIEETQIIEKTFLSDLGCDVRMTYKNPRYVTLGRDVLYDSCIDECVNRSIRDSPYSVNFKKTMVYANFKSGNLYCEYYGLPVDENNVPIIPDSDRGTIEQYLEAHIKRKILWEMQLSGDKNNIQFLYNDLRQEEQQLFRQAQQDVSPLAMKNFYALIDHRRKQMSRFDIFLK